MRRIYRVEEDKVVDGVCGGIAEYFDIDPVIVRIIFLLSTLFTGVGLIAYIICALAFPKKSKLVA
jgi:phage shock protein C